MEQKREKRGDQGSFLSVRAARWPDLDRILELYSCARAYMKRNGNGTQWGDTKPERELVEADIRAGNSYVIETDGVICGVFALVLGEDPTYQVIEGSWLNGEPYGTIHRVAGSGQVHGIMRRCLAYCEERAENIRIDTHRNNSVMRHVLESSGYVRCGVIYVADGSPRIAYQKVLR